MSDRDKVFVVAFVVIGGWLVMSGTLARPIGDGGASALVIAVGAVLYFLPSIVAALRQVENAAPTVIVNVLLGWTFIGWVVALAMAAGAKTRAR